MWEVRATEQRLILEIVQVLETCITDRPGTRSSAFVIRTFLAQSLI